MARSPNWALFVLAMLKPVGLALSTYMGVKMAPSLLQLLQLLPAFFSWSWREQIGLFLILPPLLGYLALYVWFGISGTVATAILVKRLSAEPPERIA